MTDNNMEFTKAMFDKFVKMYKEAVSKGEWQFIFMDSVFVTAYAKYLIEYLEPRFDHK